MELLNHLSSNTVSSVIESGPHILVYLSYDEMEVSSIKSGTITVVESRLWNVGRINILRLITEVITPTPCQDIIINTIDPLVYDESVGNLTWWDRRLIANINNINSLYHPRDIISSDVEYIPRSCPPYNEVEDTNTYYSQLIKYDHSIGVLISHLKLMLGVDNHSVRESLHNLTTSVELSDVDVNNIRYELLISMFTGRIPRDLITDNGVIKQEDHLYITRYMYDSLIDIPLDEYSRAIWFGNLDPKDYIHQLPIWKDKTLSYKIIYLSHIGDILTKLAKVNDIRYVSSYIMHSMVRCIGLHY